MPMKLSGDWSTNWDIFRAEFEDYSLAVDLTQASSEVQAATLRSLMGPECRHVYRYNLQLTPAERNDVKKVLEKLEEYFHQSKNVIYERYVFGCCKQEESEPIDTFVTRLRQKAASCEYGALRDELIRDKLVLGIANEATRRRLLREQKLTLTTALELCRSVELTERTLKSMEQDRPQTDSVNVAFRQPSNNAPRHNWKTTEKIQPGHDHRQCQCMQILWHPAWQRTTALPRLWKDVQSLRYTQPLRPRLHENQGVRSTCPGSLHVQFNCNTGDR